MREIPVLYENNCCMVLDKPAGLPVQGGERVRSSLDSILSEKFQPRPLLVHRLDKETSGLILVAKTKEAARVFSSLFAGKEPEVGEQGKIKTEHPIYGQRRLIVKRYLGVCSGTPKPEQGVINFSIDAKESETFYRVLSTENTGGARYSLLELELGTGRMHQIRRHLSQLGHPLLGDDKYGDFSLNKKLKAALGIKHLLLHASRLIIPPCQPLPDGLDISAPLPDSWRPFHL